MIFKGAATVYGTGASGAIQIAAEGAARLSLSPQRHTLDHRFTAGELKGAAGTVQGLYVPEAFKDIEITFIPIKTGASAIAACIADLILPAELDKVVLSGFDIAAINATYVYMGGSIESSNEAPVQWRMKLTKFVADLSATVT